MEATNYNEWQDHTAKAQQGRSQSDDARRPSWLSGAPQTRVWFCESRKVSLYNHLNVIPLR